MSRYDTYMQFAEAFNRLLPPSDEVEAQNQGFWNKLEVNMPRIIEDASDPEWIVQLLSLGVGGLRALCMWYDIDPYQSRDDLVNSLVDYLHSNRDIPSYQTVLFINEFLKRKRYDAIEEIAHLLFPESTFDVVHSSDIDSKSERLCYAILAFNENPHYLIIMMLFERAERAGYDRYELIPKMEDAAGKQLDDDTVMLAEQHIEEGVGLDPVDVGWLNDLLEVFDRQRGQKESQCWEVYHDEEADAILIFVFRSYRESYIREIEDVVFGEEAELIVLRVFDQMRIIEEHSSSGIGVDIVTAMARELYQDQNIRYIEASNLTGQEILREFIGVLVQGEDERLRLRELYLKSSPIRESPRLILRCEKSHDLSEPINDLRQRGLDLLENLHHIRNLKIAFTINLDDETEKAYSFTVYSERLIGGQFYLRFSAANIATNIRKQFELHLREEYDVRVIPGTL